MTVLIKNGHIVDAAAGRDEIADLLCNDGIIAGIGKGIDAPGANIVDASGLYVLPGLVDAHCHLRDPGQEYKEDIASGSRSAAAGGFTSIACMPNTDPPIDSAPVVRYVVEKAAREGVVHVYPIGTITKGRRGEELAEIGELRKAGAVAVSDDGSPVTSSSLMKKALQYSSMFGIPVISHCEDIDLADEGVMNEGYVSTVLGLRGIPAAAEEVMVARELVLAEYTRAHVHIAHVSTGLSVEMIRQAKKRGVRVTAETCPHYFSLTENACEGFDTMAKVNPPLRDENDVKAVIEGLVDDTIDIIATDHAPHHADEKNVEFGCAKSGMVGLETAFGLAVTYLVKPGHLDIMKLVEKMSDAPSRMLGLDSGTLEIGRCADIIIADPDRKYKVDTGRFRSKSRNTPFNGYELSGVVLHTIVNGMPVVCDGGLAI